MNIDKNLIAQYSLDPNIARNLSHSTKSVPMMEEITPRWLLTFLPWIAVEAGVYRVNKLKKNKIDPIKLQFDTNKSSTIYSKQLSNIPPFCYVDPTLVENVAPLFHKEKYKSGSTITTSKNEGDLLYIVAKGKVEVSTSGPRGEKLSISILSDGDYSNIDAFMKKSKRPVTMKALTSCEIFSLDRTAFEDSINQSPQLYDNFNKAFKKWEKEKSEVNEYGEKLINVHSGDLGEYHSPETYPEYEENPYEYLLSYIQTILKVNTQVTDIFNSPIDQMHEQLRLTIESMKEKQEWEMINNRDFGLINSVAPSMKIQTKNGVPTPDDMDELLALVWKKPAFFLAHPKAIAAFTRECTRRGVPPKTINFYGSPFITWRGVPLIPSDKLLVNGRKRHQSRCGTTNILLMRVGENQQGVIGLHQPGIPDEKHSPSLSVKFGGIDNYGISSYILTLYYSIAVLADDALGMLENVEVGNYYDYE